MVKYNYNETIGYLEIDPQFLAEGIQHAEKLGFNAIRIRTLNQNSGQKYDIDFSSFQDRLFLNRLIINDDFKIGKTLSVESLYTLKKLIHLQLNQPVFIDLSYLNQLESLYIKDDKKVKNLNSLTHLKDLLISSAKEDSCLFLKGLNQLKEFRISGNIKDLKGAENLSDLESLKITHSSKLIDIKALKTSLKLKKLHIEKCKLLSDFSFLEGNNAIKELFIDDLDSIKFISSMSELEKINFWNCKDGDMTPLLELKSLKQINFYPNKKHYSHTIEEIIKITGAKRGRNA
ncbi:hypothetical protein [Flavobacterium panacagri]|uniref:hypothetical protein n=1 Tax=Flavobacterium panacagri TaxID=3034146 RepID=UPI0025A65362|nr:hypothetical protein [Flavobacterium panacagri]